MKCKKIVVAAAVVFLCGLAAIFTGCSQVPPPDYALTGTKWTLQTDTLTGLTAPLNLPHEPITLELGEDGNAFGSTGVNLYRTRAEFVPDEAKLKFGVFVSSRMAGPGLPYEHAFKRALGETVCYEIAGDKLTLLNATGQVIAVFTGTVPATPQP